MKWTRILREYLVYILFLLVILLSHIILYDSGIVLAVSLCCAPVRVNLTNCSATNCPYTPTLCTPCIAYNDTGVCPSTRVITYSPSSTTVITSGWTNPTYAYASDDLRTYTSTDGAEQEYSGYGINVPWGATINKVEVGVESYTTLPDYEVLSVRIYDGSKWYSAVVDTYSSETLEWIDFTTSTTWTPEKVNSIKTRIYYYYTGGGGGCYPNFTKAIVYSDHHYSFKAPNEIQIGEDILCWNERDGVHLCRVTGIDKHSGEWKLLNFSIANLSLVVTDNHPIPSPELNKTMEAKEFKPGMKLRVLLNGSISLAEISSIEELNFIGEVYDIKINESSILLLLSNPPSNKFSSLDSLSAIDAEIKTYYVDWLPVRINYTCTTLCYGTNTGDNTACANLPINYCSYAGATYFADQCNSTGGGVIDRADYICRSSSFASDCTAASQCSNVYWGYCALGNPPVGFCGNNTVGTPCLLNTSEQLAQACHCVICGAQNQTPPTLCGRLFNQTRYFTSYTRTVNTVTANSLGFQVKDELSQAWLLTSNPRANFSIGIKVYVLNSTGGKTLISGTDPIGVVTVLLGEEKCLSTSWNAPDYLLASTDAILVEFYGRFENDPWTMLSGASRFVTEVLNASKLKTSTWNISYRVGCDTYVGYVTFDSISSGGNCSKISNFIYISADSNFNPNSWSGDIVQKCCGDNANEYVTQVKLANLSPFENFLPQYIAACCNASNKCVDGGICYSNWSRRPNTDAFCHDAHWRDIDDSPTYCEAAIGPNSWNLGPSAEETLYGYNACCGDDPNEFKRWRECSSEAVCSTSIYDIACCNASNKCVYDFTCYSNGSFIDINNDQIAEYCNEGIWSPSILWIRNLSTSYVYTKVGEEIKVHYYVEYTMFEFNASWIEITGAITLTQLAQCSQLSTGLVECITNFTAPQEGEYNIRVKANNTAGHLTAAFTKVYTCELLKSISLTSEPGVIDERKLLIFFNRTHLECVKETLGLTGYGFIFEVRDARGDLLQIRDEDGNPLPCRLPREATLPRNVEVATSKRYATYKNQLVTLLLYLWKL
ncbi:MAG: hypothetical protein OH337_02950 [Candidatus Parvarchaeota archaeon]|nr:hypothetical protein [Candidatus Haiyanarchaeum thermophilum]